MLITTKAVYMSPFWYAMSHCWSELSMAAATNLLLVAVHHRTANDPSSTPTTPQFFKLRKTLTNARRTTGRRPYPNMEAAQ